MPVPDNRKPKPSRDLLIETLASCEGNACAAARILGVSRDTVRRWANYYDVSNLMRKRGDDRRVTLEPDERPSRKVPPAEPQEPLSNEELRKKARLTLEAALTGALPAPAVTAALAVLKDIPAPPEALPDDRVAEELEAALSRLEVSCEAEEKKATARLAELEGRLRELAKRLKEQEATATTGIELDHLLSPDLRARPPLPN